MDKREWLKSFKAKAESICPKYGVPPEVCVAQAILESGWGIHAPGCNYFGIKGKGDDGSTEAKTQEVGPDNKLKTITDSFARYSSDEAAIKAYCELRNKPLYETACTTFKNDPLRHLAYVWASGYATSRGYVLYLAGVMKTVFKMTGDPKYNVTMDDGLKASIEAMKAVGFGAPRRKVRDLEMKTLFRKKGG